MASATSYEGDSENITETNMEENEDRNNREVDESESMEDDSETSALHWSESEYSQGNSQPLNNVGQTRSWEGFESQEERTKQVEVIGKKLVKENRQIYLAKLPSTVGVEPFAFQEWKEKSREQNESDSGRAALVKIRYRKVGNDWESNTRLVKWEDGSSSLFIGNECFDVIEQDISEESQLFLFRRQPTAQAAECRISRKLKIQPASISSGIQRKLGTYEKFAKERKVKMAEMDRAPELEEQKLAQLEHERARAQARLEAKRRRKEQLVMENWRSSGVSTEFLDNDYSSNEEFSDEEDPSFSIANVKSRISGNRKSNDMTLEETGQEEEDASLSSKAQMERENPSRLDKFKDSDTPIGTYREPLRSQVSEQSSEVFRRREK
ncbi:uncharacterized protein Gasu_36600 [Galdieria sulphuraria]|uniref:RNA polymerase-associated protein LEO1 n=1 Tax=Galdieria sulphuraria TaxID=130081 RepID=M2XZ51_GALSU|nr:uncharacterized protein Gasu_36600 [Galdieria sulphuraria]EME28923.1 hypothetical protein Gasu_36600 [Galdieria sulphuraria]|eukprot:XP_005705443.1 hypothetical protein Gasu_36600 [Galdieria sulphuraria]